MGGEQSPIPAMIATAALVYVLAFLFVFPIREATQPPGRLQAVWEALCPGTSPRWSYFGGLVMVVWSYFLVQIFLLLWSGTPFILSFIAIPNVHRAYGVPGDPSDIRRLINPSWAWVYLAPTALFAVNLVVVFRDRLFKKAA